MLPVSRSEIRTRQGCPLSGSTTRQPSLKSKRTPLGPCWVGSGAGEGYAGLGGAAAPDACVGAAEPSGAAAAALAGVAGAIGSPAPGTLSTLPSKRRYSSIAKNDWPTPYSAGTSRSIGVAARAPTEESLTAQLGNLTVKL